MKSVLAVFDPGADDAFGHLAKRYEYFTREGDNPQVGDFLVTSLPSGRAHSDKMLNLARVVEVNDAATIKATKFYLYLIPVAELKARHVADVEATVRQKERADAIKRLRELAEAKTLIDSLRGSTDPEIAALIQKIEG